MDRAILDKILKCLALGRSANEHEAAAALAKARELMDQHRITDTDLALAQIAEATARASRTSRPPHWESFLAQTVCRAIGVEGFISAAGDRTFVGRGPTAEIAGYAFAVLFRQLKTARASYIKAHLKRCRPGRRRLRADVFCLAWAASVHDKVAELLPEQERDALVGQYLAAHYPGLVKVNARSPKIEGGLSNDAWRGYVAGKSVELNTGVGGSAAPLALH
jgi:hypothetical protein